MRRRVPGCGVVVCVTLLAAAGAFVGAASVIPWQSAASYEGDVVTVEGDVARARLEGDTVVLEFSTDDAAAFRVVLLVPLITDLPRQPQRLYEGKRVRVTGKVRSWRGRPEMILRGPDAIEVVGVAAAPADGGAPPTALAAPGTTPQPPTTRAPATPPTTWPPAPPTTLPPAPPTTSPPVPPTTSPPAAAATVPPAPPTTLPPARPTVAPAAPVPPPAPAREQEEPPRLPRRVDPCVAARERWRRAAAEAETRAAALGRCLRAVDYRCRPVAAALAPALSELEWAEQQVEAACP